MKIGFMSQEYVSVTPSLEETISKGAEMGFEGIELECTTYRLSPLDLNGAKNIKELIDSNGLEISNLAPHPDFLYPAGERAMVRELLALKAVMEMAVDMDVDLIRVHIVSTLNYSSFPFVHIPGRRVYPLAAQYVRGVEGIRKATKIAEDLGVTLGLDNHMFLTMTDHLRIVKEINSPNLKLFQDVRNTVYNGEDYIAATRACGDLLVHSHVKDGIWMGGEHAGREERGVRVGKFLGGVPIGEGNMIDWEAYLKVLKEIGYAGFLSMEVHTLPIYSPWDVAAKGLKYLRNLTKKLGM